MPHIIYLHEHAQYIQKASY